MTAGLGSVGGVSRIRVAIVLSLAMAMGRLTPPAQAAEPRRVPEASLIRIEGHLGPPRRDLKPIADLRLDYRGKEYRFQATQLRRLTGQRPDSTPTFDAASHQPLFLRGADAMLQRLGTARPADRIEITGYQQHGSRELLVTEITVVPPPAAARTATPPPK